MARYGPILVNKTPSNYRISMCWISFFLKSYLSSRRWPTQNNILRKCLRERLFASYCAFIKTFIVTTSLYIPTPKDISEWIFEICVQTSHLGAKYSKTVFEQKTQINPKNFMVFEPKKTINIEKQAEKPAEGPKMPYFAQHFFPPARCQRPLPRPPPARPGDPKRRRSHWYHWSSIGTGIISN